MSGVKTKSIQTSSYLDPGGVLKSAHNDNVQSLKVYNSISEVPPTFGRVELVHNKAGSCTQATFYEGQLHNILQITCTSAEALNNNYFTIYSANDARNYTVWFNVDNNGSAPTIDDTLLLEVALSSSDIASIVAFAIKYVLQNIQDFKVDRNLEKLTITNVDRGSCGAHSESGTGFTFITQQLGTDVVIKQLNLPYENGVKYNFNSSEKKFTTTGPARGEGLKPPSGADAFSVAYPLDTREVYSYFSGGLSGTLLATITINYTDNTKSYISNFEIDNEI
jgi:hypothetical protein